MMQTKQAYSWILAALVIASTSRNLQGQHYQPFGPVDYNPDWQWFAPDLHLNPGPRPNEGYFFGYERLNWSLSKPSRAPIGIGGPAFGTLQAPTVVIPSPLAPGDNQAGVAPTQTTASANITSNDAILIAVPNTEFGWGNRIDLGYLVDRDGWLLSVQWGLKQTFEHQYGMDDVRLMQLPSAQGIAGLDGVSINDPAFGSPPPAPDPGTPQIAGDPPVAPIPGILGYQAIQGLLAVPIFFEDPFGLLRGFIDINNDEIPDDVNLNGVFGNLEDTDGDGTPDALVPVDEGDIFALIPEFDQVNVRNHTKLSSVELMKMRRLTPTHHGSIIELFYGVRYVKFRDRFSVEALGGPLADSYWLNDATSNIVGPQFGFSHYNKRGRWTFGMQGRFLAGANFSSLKLNGILGSEIVPGQPNNPAFMGPSLFVRGVNDNFFSPVGELRVDTSFQLAKSVSLQVGWTGVVIDNVTRASNTIDYRLPTLELSPSEEEVFINGLNFGVVVNR